MTVGKHARNGSVSPRNQINLARIEVLEDRRLLSAAHDAISGRIFNDLAVTGKFRAKDPGLAGCLVYIDTNHNGVFDGTEPTATTDQAGKWSITNLSPGTYVVRESILPGYRATTTETMITVKVNGRVSGKLFGPKPPLMAVVTGSVFPRMRMTTIEKTLRKKESRHACLPMRTATACCRRAKPSFGQPRMRHSYKLVVAPGIYNVVEIEPKLTYVAMPAADYHTLDLGSGQVVTSIDFANHHGKRPSSGGTTSGGSTSGTSGSGSTGGSSGSGSSGGSGSTGGSTGDRVDPETPSGGSGIDRWLNWRLEWIRFERRIGIDGWLNWRLEWIRLERRIGIDGWLNWRFEWIRFERRVRIDWWDWDRLRNNYNRWAVHHNCGTRGRYGDARIRRG